MTDRLLPAALLEQRRALRRRLQAQRQLVASQLDPLPVRQRYRPRSKTMRFLTQQPALAAGLLAALATLLIGVRFLRAMTTMLAVTRLLSSISARSTQHEALPMQSLDSKFSANELTAQEQSAQEYTAHENPPPRQTKAPPSVTEFSTAGNSMKP